jgi:hypothetical protein
MCCSCTLRTFIIDPVFQEMSKGSVPGRVTDLQQEDRLIVFQFPTRARYFSVLHSARRGSGCGAYLTSCYRELFPRWGRWSVRSRKLTTHLRLVPRLRGSGTVYVDSPVCLHGLHRDSFLYCLCKVAPVRDIKAYRRSRGIVPPGQNFGTRWWWVVNFTSRPLCYQGKNSRYPLDRRLDGP